MNRCAYIPFALLSLCAHQPTVSADPVEVDSKLRTGVYSDSDDTNVWRGVATFAVRRGDFAISLRESVDVVSSASIDVRSSPALDAISSASILAAKMNERRFETGVALTWNDGRGHRLTLSPVVAFESDYESYGVGMNGAWDVARRNTTLVAGTTISTNHIASVLDEDFSESLHNFAYAAGVTQVLSKRDLVRVRYDGAVRRGYQASAYRAVRFGDWNTQTRPDSPGLQFEHVIGPTWGFPELLPTSRIRHAISLEWTHGLWRKHALQLRYRFGADSWGLLSHTPAANWRTTLSDKWLLNVSYRYYHQAGASFWRGKYVLAETNYSYYTADKELGDMRGHNASVGLVYQLPPWRDAANSMLDVRVHAMRYRYPGFALLPKRRAITCDIGARLEF